MIDDIPQKVRADCDQAMGVLELMEKYGFPLHMLLDHDQEAIENAEEHLAFVRHLTQGLPEVRDPSTWPGPPYSPRD